MGKAKLNAPDKGQSKENQRVERIQRSSFSTVLGYCLLIIFSPILAFFISKNVLFDGILALESIQSNIYSAVTAVVALHLALFLYIYRAYFESDAQDAKKKA